MQTIKLKGKLDLDLMLLGLKTGDIIKAPKQTNSNGAIYFIYNLHGWNYDCVVYQENYEIIEDFKSINEIALEKAVQPVINKIEKIINSIEF